MEKGLFSRGLLRCRSRADQIAVSDFLLKTSSVSPSWRQIKLVDETKAVKQRLERLNNLPLNTITPNFVAIFVFFGTTSSFIERISSSETEAKREAIGCSGGE